MDRGWRKADGQTDLEVEISYLDWLLLFQNTLSDFNLPINMFTNTLHATPLNYTYLPQN